MPRAALITLVCCAAAFAWSASATDPHLDRSVLPDGCVTCHAGHGAPDSPMMPSGQKEICLSCHGENVTAATGPKGLATKIPSEAMYKHPIDDQAFERGPGAVTCTSCHSPHRGRRAGLVRKDSGGKRHSPRDPRQFEHELCEGCHGGGPDEAPSSDWSVADRISALNPSYHPVQAPAAGSSGSLKPSLSGREINCTDCHGDQGEKVKSKGVHGSPNIGLLVNALTRTDGADESLEAYQLCYACHERESILADASFPSHREHVVDLKTSCSTCHDPHGSLVNRSLIRIGDSGDFVTLSPSTSTGRLAFESRGPGSGACYVTCHGRDHGPEAYGSMELLVRTGIDDSGVLTPRIPTRRRPTRIRPGGGLDKPGPPTRVDDPKP